MALTHPIRVARGEHDVELARSLFREYAAWLGVDLCFQGFEEELAALPGKYASPLGILLLAGPPGDAVGCAALRPLPSLPPEPRTNHVPGGLRKVVRTWFLRTPRSGGRRRGFR